EVEGEAAVAGCVLMAAFEAAPLVAQQHGARGEDGGAPGRAVLERALRHRGNARSMVALFERPVARAGGARYIADTPTRAGRQQARSQCHGPNIAIFPKQRSGRAA